MQLAVPMERAGPRADIGHLLHFGQVPGAHLSSFHPSFRLDQVGVADPPSAETTGVHGPAGEDQRGEVQTPGGHEHPRRHLIAIGNEDHGIQAVGGDHQFDGVGDQLPADHGHFHARVARGDAVADGDGGKFQGGPPGFRDPQFDGLGQGVQMDMPRHEFVEGIYHRDQRLFQMGRMPAHGVEKGAVGGPVQALGNGRTPKLPAIFFFQRHEGYLNFSAAEPIRFPLAASPAAGQDANGLAKRFLDGAIKLAQRDPNVPGYCWNAAWSIVRLTASVSM